VNSWLAGWMDNMFACCSNSLLSDLDNIVMNGGVISNRWLGKDLEGSDHHHHGRQ
jgi:hypothetical protein